MAERQRLLVEDVDSSAGDRLIFKRRNEICLDHDWSARRVPPQTVLDAPGEGGGAHSGLPPQTFFGAFAKSIPKSPNYYAKIAVVCGGLANA
jgi:hypothetical protein